MGPSLSPGGAPLRQLSRDRGDIMARITKAQEKALSFSRFVARLEAINETEGRTYQDGRCSITDGSEFTRLANSAFRWGERNCNEDLSEAHQKRADNVDRKLDVLAEAYGFKVNWPGLWPRLMDSDGRDVYIPA